MKLFRILKLAWQNFWRNRLLSLAATLITSLTVITVITLMVLNFFADAFVEKIHNRIDMEIYLMDDAKNSDLQNLQNELESNADITSVTFISKAEALEIWRQKMANKPKLIDIVSAEDNPLPASFKVKMKDPEKIKQLAADLKSKYGSETIEYISTENDQKIIDQIVSTTKKAKMAGYLLFALFLIISILIVFNTMRITIFTRREEIEIMKLVGATNTYIRWPFIIEALLYGIFAAAASLIGGYFILTFANPKILAYTGIDVLLLFETNGLLIFAAAFGLGIILSTAASMTAIRKYLKIQ
jgi:cell division transport system permease protein